MKIFLRILSFVKPFWKHLAIAILNIVLFAAMNGLSIYLTIPLLDNLFNQNSNEAVKKAASTSGSSLMPDFITNFTNAISNAFNHYVLSGSAEEVLLKISLLIVLTFILKNIFSYISNYFIAYVEQGIIRDIRNKLYSHIQNLPIGYFKNEKTGDLISRFTNDVNIIQQSVTTVFLNIFREPLTIIVFFVL